MLIDFTQDANHRAKLYESLSKDPAFAHKVKTYADHVWWSLKQGGRVMFVGNGGSAADAQHLAAEYIGIGMSGLALTTDTSVLTALGNDVGYTRVFGDQVATLGRKRDVLVLHSTSGESRNLVYAVQAAQAVGMRTIGLTARGGGTLAGLVDWSIVVPTDDTQLAQEVHLAIGHVVWQSIRARNG